MAQLKPNLARALLNRCEEVAGVLKSLSHPIRLKILCQLLEGERTVSDLTEFCEISQSAMSQFLGRMKDEEVLDSRREGSRVFYRIADPKLTRLLGAIREIYC